MPTYFKNLNEYKTFIQAKGLVIIDFYADWCGPCKQIAPMFEEWSKKYEKVAFGKVNVDESDDIATHEAIEAMPTFKFYLDGKFLKNVVGANTKDILETLEKYGL